MSDENTIELVLIIMTPSPNLDFNAEKHNAQLDEYQL
jgi:hypothetical protein